MIKIYLLIIILELYLLKETPIIYMGVNTTYDEKNTFFQIKYNGQETDTLIMNFKTLDGTINFELNCKSQHVEYNCAKCTIYNHKIKKNDDCTIKFFWNDEIFPGTVLFYSIKTPIKIKLRNLYGDIDYQSLVPDSSLHNTTQISYLVPNLERNARVKFDYKSEFEDEKLFIENPFEICQNKVCKRNITTYDFKKGESYKITIKFTRYKNKIYWPAYSFYDVNYYNGTYDPDDVIIDDESGNNSNILKLNIILISLVLLTL